MFGEENFKTAESYHSVGVAQHSLGYLTTALESHKRALEIRVKLLGEKHSETADSYHEVGGTQYSLGNYTAALESHKRALEIRVKLFGEEMQRPLTATGQCGSSRVLRRSLIRDVTRVISSLQSGRFPYVRCTRQLSVVACDQVD